MHLIHEVAQWFASFDRGFDGLPGLDGGSLEQWSGALSTDTPEPGVPENATVPKGSGTSGDTTVPGGSTEPGETGTKPGNDTKAKNDLPAEESPKADEKGRTEHDEAPPQPVDPPGVTDETRADDPEESGFGFTTLLLTALGSLLVGGLLVYYGLADRFGADREPQDAPAGEPAALAAAAWAGPSGVRSRKTARDGDRRKLIDGLIDLADRLRDHNPGLWKAANRRLEEVGVTVYLPDGETFDSSRHNAVGYQETSLPVNHLTVASTERTGYLDRGEVLRVPDVIVYRATGDRRVG